MKLPLQFISWFQFYTHIYNTYGNKPDNERFIMKTVGHTDGMHPELSSTTTAEYTFGQIKAKAFDELYPIIPTADEMKSLYVTTVFDWPGDPDQHPIRLFLHEIQKLMQ